LSSNATESDAIEREMIELDRAHFAGPGELRAHPHDAEEQAL